MTRPLYFLALFAAILLISTYPAAHARKYPEMPQTYSLYQVLPGEGYDAITDKFLPNVPYDTAKRWIQAANGMPPDYTLQPGDVLNVPDPTGPLPEPLGPSYSSEEAAQAANREFSRLIEEARKAQEEAERQQAREEHADKPLASRAGPSLDFLATAYTQREEEGTADGITATRTRVKPGVVAVDRRVIPLGSWLYIESDFPYVSGYYRAEDVGGAIKGQRVDIYMASLSRAMDFGKRRVRVRVITQ